MGVFLGGGGGGNQLSEPGAYPWGFSKYAELNANQLSTCKTLCENKFSGDSNKITGCKMGCQNAHNAAQN